LNTKNLKYHLAPFGVAIGITVFITISMFISKKLHIKSLSEVVQFLPRSVTFTIGLILVIMWFPIFIAGIYYLKRRGAVGQSEKLVINGIYMYVRNPMYSGISFTIIGLGLILNATGIVLAGIFWFVLVFIQCKREERELKDKFGEQYVEYKKKAPLLIPRPNRLLEDLIQARNHA